MKTKTGIRDARERIVKEYFSLPDSERTTMAYHQGVTCFLNKMACGTCPYAIGHANRTAWMAGWLDARTRQRMRSVFKSYNVTYP